MLVKYLHCGSFWREKLAYWDFCSLKNLLLSYFRWKLSNICKLNLIIFQRFSEKIFDLIKRYKKIFGTAGHCSWVLPFFSSITKVSPQKNSSLKSTTSIRSYPFSLLLGVVIIVLFWWNFNNNFRDWIFLK